MPYKNLKQSEAAVNAAHAYYREYVNNAIERAGNAKQLAEAIGMSYTTLRSVIERDEFAPMRRLANRIAGKV